MKFLAPPARETHFSLAERRWRTRTVFLEEGEKLSEGRIMWQKARKREEREICEQIKMGRERKDKTEKKDTRKSLEAISLFVFMRDKIPRYFSADVTRKYLPCWSASRARVFIQVEGWNAKLKRHSSADPRQSNPFSSLHSARSIVSSYCWTRVRRL